MLVRHGGLVFLVPGELLEDCLDFLDQRDEDNEGGSGEGPEPADNCPGVELSIIEDIDGEHGAWPDDDKQDGEADGGNVGGDLGGSELADDNIQRRTVMEVLHVIKVQLSLILGHPGAQGVVNVPGLLPLLLLNLRGHVPPCDEGHQDGENSPHADSGDVSKEHRDLLAGILDKGGSGQTPGESASQGEPDRHASDGAPHNPADGAIAGGAGPEDGDGDGDHGGGD